MSKTTAVLAFALLLGCGGSRPQAGELTGQVMASVDGSHLAYAVAEGAHDDEGEGLAVGASDCLVGVWTAKEQGRTRTLTFRADHTGEDVPAAGHVRRFLWREGNMGRVRLCYPEEGDAPRSEWELQVDCASRVITYRGARYTRTD